MQSFQSHESKTRGRRLPASEEATFTTSRFRVIIPHPGEPEPEPEIHDIPRCVAKYEGPLSKCNKICSRMRKVTSIANDFETERLGLKVRTINKEQKIVINKHNSETQPFQKSLQELRGYQTALGQKRMSHVNNSMEMLVKDRGAQLSSRSLPDMRRSGVQQHSTGSSTRRVGSSHVNALLLHHQQQEEESGDAGSAREFSAVPPGGGGGAGLVRQQTCLTEQLPPFGRYEGVAIRELRDDIKRLVEENHPRARRIRHAHRLMESNQKKSLLATPHLLQAKLDDICTRPWAEFKLIPKNVKPSHEAFGDQSKIQNANGISGPAMVDQGHKGYGNFYTSAGQAFVFN